MVILIIGLFNSTHFIVGLTAYDKYPLKYGAGNRCDYMPVPASINGVKETKGTPLRQGSEGQAKEDCLKSLEIERQNTKKDDLEKSIAFTAIGLLIFGVHFYFARRR